MSKRQNEIEELRRDLNLTNNIIWIIFIGLIGLILVVVFCSVNYIDNKLKDLPHKVCENVTYIENQSITEQTPCPCCTGEPYTTCCAMMCFKVVGYENITKTKEVCKIE